MPPHAVNSIEVRERSIKEDIIDNLIAMLDYWENEDEESNWWGQKSKLFQIIPEFAEDWWDQDKRGEVVSNTVNQQGQRDDAQKIGKESKGKADGINMTRKGTDFHPVFMKTTPPER